MLGLVIDAAVLIFMLKVVNDDDIGFGTAFVVALVAAIGTTALAYGLGAVMGLAGVLLATVIAAIALGVAVSALFGVEIKRSFLIAGVFMVVHLGVGVGFQLMMAS